MANLNMNTNKYIFKKNLNLRRKSNRRLIIESAFMFIFSFLLVYINYLIPNKNLLLQTLTTNLNKSFKLLVDLMSSISNIFLVIYIFVSSILILVLLTGSFYRLIRVVKRQRIK